MYSLKDTSMLILSNVSHEKRRKDKHEAMNLSVVRQVLQN